jgi:hypothetical protein
LGEIFSVIGAGGRYNRPAGCNPAPQGSRAATKNSLADARGSVWKMHTQIVAAREETDG